MGTEQGTGVMESHVSLGRHKFLAGVPVLTFLFYLALLPHWVDRLDPLTGDEPFYVMTAISLIRDFDLDESNNYQAVTVAGESGAQTWYAFAEELNPPEPLPANWNGWPSPPRLVAAHAATTDRDGLYTKHGIGLSLLIAVPYEIGGRVGADLIAMIAGALLAAQMFLLAREAGAGQKLSAVIALGLAVALPLGPYALLLFPEIPAALLLIYAIRRLAAPSNEWWQWLLASSAIGFLPWLHQRFAPTAAVLGLFALIRIARSRDLRSAVPALAPVAIGGLALINYNLWLYGSPVQATEDHAGFSGLSGTINGAFGLLLDAQWGLIIAAPVMLLALAATPRWFVSRPRTALVAFAAVTPYLMVVAAYRVWWGEWGPAARYLVPIVPLAAGPLAAWLAGASWRWRIATCALWFAGMLATLIGYQDPQRFYHHPDGFNQLLGQLGAHLGLDIQRVLVPFQPYAIAPLASRFWLGATLVGVLLLLGYLVSGPAIRDLARRTTINLGRSIPGRPLKSH